MQALESNNRANVRNAVMATGYPITLYNTLRTGVQCTCQFLQQPPNQILNSEGKLSERDMLALVSPSVSGVFAYNPAIPVYNANNNTRIQLSNTAPPAKNQEDEEFERLVSEWDEQQEAIEVDQSLGGERLLSTQAKSCGICFGSGYEGGYELVHGTRLILTVQNQPKLSPGVVIDRMASPNAIQFPSQGGTITFTVVFPIGSEYALYPRVMNNTQIVPYTGWKLLDNQGQELVPDYIKAKLCIGKPVDITLTIPASGSGTKITHLELILSGRPLDQPIKADSPEISDITDVTRMDSKTNVTWILGGTHNISRRAVVIDHLPRISRHWRINDIAVRRDQFGFVYEQTGTSRLIDVYEITQLLRPVKYERTPLD